MKSLFPTVSIELQQHYIWNLFFPYLLRFEIDLWEPFAKNMIVFTLSQLTFTCWKSIIETLEKGVKYVQS